MADATDRTGYCDKLKDALSLQRSIVEESVLPKLKEDFRAFHNSFYSLYKLMVSRGILHADPYKTESKITAIQAPSTANFADSDRSEQLSIRLSQFDNQLDYLVNFFDFSKL
jgi:hypothetical protein